MTDALYQEYILDLYRHPRNKTMLKNFDFTRHEKNPLCSDEIDVFIKLDKAEKITELGWTGEGCAISTAATSLLTDYLKNKSKADISKLSTEKMLKILGLPKITPARIGCATLGLKAINNAIK
ncbi:MAG: iron-sulfur cluster assembly scaffold protein [Candidatus Magasanikbacteria bacterium]|nr:iron-sulfur cluster assembly scaffold protein [Candidatus Magasanikbacteria bacterium]